MCRLLRSRGLNLIPKNSAVSSPSCPAPTGAVRIPAQGLPDLLELRRDSLTLGSRPAAAVLFALLPAAPSATPRGPDSGSGILQPLAARARPAGPLPLGGGALGWPPLEALAGHPQRAESLQHRELLLRQLEVGASGSRPGPPHPRHVLWPRGGAELGTSAHYAVSGLSWARTHYVYRQCRGRTTPDTHTQLQHPGEGTKSRYCP